MRLLVTSADMRNTGKTVEVTDKHMASGLLVITTRSLRMIIYKVLSQRLELPRGTKFTAIPSIRARAGALCLLRVDGWITIGRPLFDVNSNFIVQPSRLTNTGRLRLEVLGLVQPV